MTLPHAQEIGQAKIIYCGTIIPVVTAQRFVHLAAMVRTHRSITDPTPGFYLVSLVPKGWGVPARIVRVSGRFSAWCDGKPVVGAWRPDDLERAAVEAMGDGELFAHPFLRISLFGTPTDRATYDHRLAMKDWATAHCPDHPCLHPLRPMDPRTLPAEDF